ncbi:hypothetical protein Trydic_g9880 [Trypoxylus dichotomus]
MLKQKQFSQYGLDFVRISRFVLGTNDLTVSGEPDTAPCIHLPSFATRNAVKPGRTDVRDADANGASTAAVTAGSYRRIGRLRARDPYARSAHGVYRFVSLGSGKFSVKFRRRNAVDAAGST